MSGLDNLKTRVSYYGETIDDRINQEKLDSFYGSLKDSYQAENITFNGETYRCLINPSKLTEDTDIKQISIDYSSGIKEGDVFYWDRTEKMWMVTLRQFTEEPYFRGLIKKCNYKINIDGNDYWVVVRGPVETQTTWSQKHDISFNDLNLSLLMTIKKDSRTVEYFSRFSNVKIDMIYEDVVTGEATTQTHKWEVVATDKYASDSVIQVYLREDYDNDMEDKVAEAVPEPPETSDGKVYIDGPQVLEAYQSSVEYSIKNNTLQGSFVIEGCPDSAIRINNSNSNTVNIDILTGKRYDIEIKYYYNNTLVTSLPVRIDSF